jgi:hypothetical protein
LSDLAFRVIMALVIQDVRMNTLSDQEEQDLTFVDNEEGFDVFKRPYQKRDRAAASAGHRTSDTMFSVTSSLIKNMKDVKITFQDHEDAF